MNKANPLDYCEKITCCNPCGEQFLPPYGACLLGSINLAALVSAPFSPGAAIDGDALRKLTGIATRMLDNVIDISGYPLPEQANEAKAKRRIGIGVTGLADALIMCGLHYGTPDARRVAANWMGHINKCARMASENLAMEKGVFPAYDPAQYPPHHARTRNSHLTSIAPTGTISMLAGNVSSGIEPIFDLTHVRKILKPDGSRREEIVEDFAHWRFYADYPAPGPVPGLPPAFITAPQLSTADHLEMQAALQPHVDSAISKTINCPKNIPFEDFQGIYKKAYVLGLKGCTVFRPNAITGSVLQSIDASGTNEASANQEEADQDIAPFGELPAVDAEPEGTFILTPEGKAALRGLVHDASGAGQLPPRERALTGVTYKLKWPDSEHATYITINDTVASGQRCPYEIFINSKNLEHYAWTVALTRMISAIFRRGGDISFVAEELKAVFDPRGGAYHGGQYVPSLLAAIGGVIHGHVKDCQGAPGVAEPADLEKPLSGPAPAMPLTHSVCPQCLSANVIMEEGCRKCRTCGWSKC